MKRIEHLINGSFGMLFNCHSGTESATLFVAVKYYGHQPSLVTTLRKSFANLAHHRNVENIQRGTGKGDARDAIVNRESNMFVIVSH
jgi:hypothetical protein